MDMNSLLFAHSVLLEGPGIVLLLIIAWLTHLTHKGDHHASSITIVSAFLLTAFEDIVHAGLSYINPNLLPDWVPLTWALSRTSLIVMIIIALLFQAFKVRNKIWGLMVASLGILFIALPTLIPYTSAEYLDSLSFIQTNNFIKRPLEILPFILYAGTWIASCTRFSSQIILPSSVRWFLGIGALVHLPMIFGSAEFMDISYVTSHFLKNVEYAIWTWFAYFDYQIRLLTSHSTFMQGKATCLRTYTKINIDQLNESVKNLNKLIKE